jgi:hypothetical protein
MCGNRWSLMDSKPAALFTLRRSYFTLRLDQILASPPSRLFFNFLGGPSQKIKAATLQSDSRVFSISHSQALECPNAVYPPLSTPIQNLATRQTSSIPIVMTRRKGKYLLQSRKGRKRSKKFTPLLPPLHARLILAVRLIRSLHTLLNLLVLYVSLC